MEVRLPDLAPFTAYAGQELHGSAVIHAQIAGYPAATRIKLDANAALTPGTQVWAGALGERVRLEFSGAFKDASLAMENAKLSGRAIVFVRQRQRRWPGNRCALGLVACRILAACPRRSREI